MAKSSTTIHNDGQRDASSGSHNPPHSTAQEVKAFCGLSHKSYSEVHDDNRAYGNGRDNVK